MTLYGLCHNASYAESRLSPARAQRYGARLARTIVYGSDESRAAVIANARDLQAAGVETLVVVTTETTGHAVDDLDAWTHWIAAFLDEAQGAVYAIEPGNELDTPGWTMSDGAPISDELIIAIGRRAAEVCRYRGVLCTSPSLLTGPEEGRFEAVARGLAGHVQAMAVHPYYCAVGGVPDRPETRQEYPPPLRAHRWRYGAVEEKAAVCERLGHGLPVWFTELGCPVGFDAITAQEQALWTYHLRRFQHPAVEVALQFCLTDAMVPQAEIDEQKYWGITDAQGEKVSALMLAGYTTPPRPVTTPTGGLSMPSSYRVGPGVLEAMRQHGDQPGSDECYYPVGAKTSQWSETMALSGAIYRYLFATNQTYRFPPDQTAAALVRN